MKDQLLKIYNEETTNYLLRFINEFQEYFPNILSNEDLIERIKTSLKHNIDFIVFTKDNKKYSKEEFESLDFKPPVFNLKADFSIYERKISLSAYADQESLDCMFFHEMIHAISTLYSSFGPYIYLSEEYKDPNLSVKNTDGFNESIVSLFEERLRRKKYNFKGSKVNGYIPNYARALEIIFGEDLFKNYIELYTNISTLFQDKNAPSYIDVGYEDLYSIINPLAKIYSSCGMRGSICDYDVDLLNMQIDLSIDKILYKYFENNNLSDKEKLDKLSRLFELQETPNLDLYQEMINKFIKDKSLLKNYGSLKYFTNDKNIEDNKIIRFLALKYFNFDTKNYTNINQFLSTQSLYIGLTRLILNGELNIESIYNIKSLDNRMDTMDYSLKTKEELLYGYFKTEPNSNRYIINDSMIMEDYYDYTYIYRKINKNVLINRIKLSLDYNEDSELMLNNILNYVSSLNYDELYVNLDILDFPDDDITIYYNNNGLIEEVNFTLDGEIISKNPHSPYTINNIKETKISRTK